jgi:hypothetical protein
MATAISSGMLDPHPYRSLSNVTANCPNDRCTWEPYTSIGICYTTEDITSAIVELKSANTTATVLATTEIAGTGYNISADNWLYIIFKSVAFYWDGSFFPTDHIPPPNKTDSNMPNLADILLLYFDPCLGEHGEAKAYKAFRATTSLCLQSIDTSFNISTNTTLLSSTTALDWTLGTAFEKNLINITQYCTWYNGETFCIDRLNLIVIGGQIAMAFNQLRKLANSTEEDTSVTIGGVYLMQDIMGTNPTNCSNETGLGFEGFERRIRNVAISMTNAYVLSFRLFSNEFCLQWGQHADLQHFQYCNWHNLHNRTIHIRQLHLALIPYRSLPCPHNLLLHNHLCNEAWPTVEELAVGVAVCYESG